MKADAMMRKWVTVIAYLCLGAAGAENNSATRLSAFAKLPDWSGIWENDQHASSGTANAPKGYADLKLLTLTQFPPYRPEWAAKVNASIKADPAAQTPDKKCLFGFPANMNSPWMFELWAEPQETLVLFHGDDVRHIYTDGRAHPGPDDIWPTPMGDSIGHWEGDTLVVDTIARRDDKGDSVFLNPLYTVSEQFHVIERIRMTDHNHIENAMTLLDPLAFGQPWHVTLHYKRVTDVDRMLWESCTDQDRNVVQNGVMSFTPPIH